MCGINGIFNGELTKDITDILIHRGPDQKGLYHSKNCTLSNNRLSIVDIDEGVQPVENGRYVMSFNGEIYNYKELVKSANLQDTLKNNSDSEVLLEYITKKGLSSVCDLRGMFAFALYDKQLDNISLFRDRTGIKPLFYNVDSSQVRFGSEIKSIFNMGLTPEFDEETLADFFIIGFPLGASTLFKNVYQVEPGSYITINKEGELNTTKYFDYISESKSGVGNCSPDLLADLINQSVKEQIDSNWPILLMLSGGLDSGTLLHSIIDNFGIENLKLFTFSESHDDKDYFASKKLADFYGLPLKIVSQRKSFLQNFKTYLYHLEDISFDSYAIWALSEEMTKFGKVGYCGQGADEMFGGYSKHFNSQAYLDKIKGNFDRFIKVYGKDFRNYFIIKEFIERLQKGDGVQETTHFDVWQELPNIQLWQYDRVSMAHGFELRVPYLDERIISFSAKLNAEHKICDGHDKFILRQASRKLGAPKIVWDRPKCLGGQNIIQNAVQKLKDSFTETHDSKHPMWNFFHQTSWMYGSEPIYCGMMDILEKIFELK